MAQSARNERIINDRIMQNHKISSRKWAKFDYLVPDFQKWLSDSFEIFESCNTELRIFKNIQGKQELFELEDKKATRRSKKVHYERINQGQQK